MKSLTAFPQVLSMMNSQLDWTQKIGDAMIGQQATWLPVQRLRAKCRRRRQSQEQPSTAEGHEHRSSTEPTIVIEPANPELIYVPYYNPVAYEPGRIPPIRLITIRHRRPTAMARRWPPASCSAWDLPQPERCSAAGTGTTAPATATSMSTSTTRPTSTATSMPVAIPTATGLTTQRIATGCPIVMPRPPSVMARTGQIPRTAASSVGQLDGGQRP